MITKQYNLVNNIGGWLVFIVALLTYWLTLEPTASYWDCGEFIVQGQKLEVGHPPGNPIFMLTANLFANFAPTPEKVSVMINAMSGLLSALTILILFWTVTHLVRRLVVKDGRTEELSIQQYLIIMGSGVVGALAYCWSDTFWFSAVESEVYAFSSFCTALVFWLILKWENRADQPHSDRYLILIAYVIGVSLAVHLLNLLCIPAIVLVYVYRRKERVGVAGSLLAIVISFVILFFILYGLMPGFLKVAQITELIFVNGFHLGFNSGALAYAIIMIASLLWALNSLYRQKSEWQIQVSFILAVTLSGMLFVGKGVAIGIVLTVGLICLMFWGFRKTGIPVRALYVTMWSIAAIFIGFSSYALILIRSTADTPMNENAPDNIFTLASYLNREQYGETPLLYGPTLYSSPQLILKTETNEYGQSYITGEARKQKGARVISKSVPGAQPHNANKFLSDQEVNSNKRLADREGDAYIVQDYKEDIVMNPELNMVFPRIHSRAHERYYGDWFDFNPHDSTQMPYLSIYNPVTEEDVMPDDDQFNYLRRRGKDRAYKPTFAQNLEYFFNYQIYHMYLRYFLWNFVGRQNDVNNQQGEVDTGNWISGFSALDNRRLGDQSLLPDHLGENNPAHNVYYFLPLLLGIIGLIWQSFAGRRGIEQFWVVFMLFFMTGIAIVIYLNQYPNQPRERDYAFAGSFYAFAIWIGMGVAGLWRFFMLFVKEKVQQTPPPTPEETKPAQAAARTTVPMGQRIAGMFKTSREPEPIQSKRMTEEPAIFRKPSLVASIVAVALGICVPLQMVSQTWDDHDRSGRYAARDFAINYLESLEPNAIIFCNGDNDTFPLWYAQEVEGVRPDVRIINLSYLNSDWYANQQRIPLYDAAPAPMTATPADIAYGNLDIALVPPEPIEGDLLQSLKALYAQEGVDVDPDYGYHMLPASIVTIPIDKKLMVERGLVAPADTADMVDKIQIDLRTVGGGKGYLTLGETLMLDIIATNAALGWPRPIYWATTVGIDTHVGLTPYLRSTGMANQLTPTYDPYMNMNPRTDRAYENITQKFQWGWRPGEKMPYFDETARRMLYSMRNSMIDLAEMFCLEGQNLEFDGKTARAREAYNKALNLLNLLEEKLPAKLSRFEIANVYQMANTYFTLAEKLDKPELKTRGLDLLKEAIGSYAKTLQLIQDLWDINGSTLSADLDPATRAKRLSQLVRWAWTTKTPGKNTKLSWESQTLPRDYNTLVNLYLQNGGDRNFVDSTLRSVGLDTDDVNVMSETIMRMLRPGDYADEDDEGGFGGVPDEEDLALLQQLAENIIAYSEDIARLQTLSPEDYMKEDIEIRQVDTILDYYIQQYLYYGGDEDVLYQSPAYRSLDRLRSQRLLEEYLDKHR